jgi:hypothetical protein
MALAILDNLQTLDLDAKSTFADDSSFVDAQGFVRSNLGNNPLQSLDAGGLTSAFDQVTQTMTGSGNAAVPQAPFSVKELQTNITGKLDGLSGLNLASLQQAIPSNPGQSSFQDSPMTAGVNQAVGNLTAGITGNPNFGKFDLPAAGNNPFGEFQDFLNQAGALPSRVLDAILKALKKLFDKIANPDAWLSDLSGAALTEIFVEQIQDVSVRLPQVAIAQVSQSLDLRTKTLEELNTWLAQLPSPTLTREQFPALRQQVKTWIATTETGDQQIQTAVTNLTAFDWAAFQNILDQLADSTQGDTQTATLSTLFNGVQTFLDNLNGRIEDVTKQLQAFIQKIQAFITKAIETVGEVANKVVDTIATQINAAGQALDKVVAYLKEAIAKLEAFVQQACDQSDQIVQPLKNALNQFSDKAVTGIKTLAGTVKEQTQKLQTAVENVNQNIVTKLNREELEKKIRELLSKVTNVLESPSVTDALTKAEAGIDQIVAALQKVSLDPAFDLAVRKTGELETKLKQVNVATLGTAQKAALKVGTKILQQVDVPGTVNPELTAAFDQVLDPVVNLVNSIQAEVRQIDTKVEEFQPGTLAAKFLAPYLDPLIVELDQYKPSLLLAKVEEIYNTLLDKLEILNPDQLLQLLDQLYDKLVEVIKALSPEELTKFIKQKLDEIAAMLDQIPIEQLVNKVIDSIGSVEKILGGLGLDSVLKSDFWQTLEEVLTLSVQDKIQKIDDIKAEVVRRVNGIDEAPLNAALATLRTAIDDVNQNSAPFKEMMGTAVTTLDTAWTRYQTAVTTFAGQWTAHQQRLDQFTPTPDCAVDYRDLRERLATLHDRLIAIAPLEAQINQVKTQADIIIKQPAKDRKPALKLDRTNADILATFKQVIPTEIERELTGPMKKMLNTLDQILAKPRAILDSIKAVIQQLATAPKELATILKQLATSLGKVIRGAIDKVKTVIQGFDVNFLTSIHAKIVSKLEEFSPILVMNAFYADSDFSQSNPAKFLQRLRSPAATDKVSAYFLSQLEEAQRTLLASSDGPGAKKALMQGLNQLLRDPNFYSADRFTPLTLPSEARELIEKANRTVKETIRLNRLLLEAAYPDEIPMSVQSIFPFFVDQLRSLYPTELVKQLDAVHANIVQVIRDFPKALEGALNAEYQKVVKVYQAIRALIDKIFKALIDRLRGLQSELGIGLEDISDAYGRLLVAIPV